MKKILIGFLLLLIVGCANIRHKTFRVVTVAQAGKVTVTDPTGSGVPLPQVVLGTFTNIVNTIPIGAKMESRTVTYQLFSNNPAFEETLIIDATKVPIEVLYDKKDLIKK